MFRRTAVLSLFLLTGACALLEPHDRSYVVFFKEFSTATDADVLKVIAAAADDAQAHPSQAVTVSGYTAPTGTAAANAALARLRTETIVAALAKAGVPITRIARREVGPVAFVLDDQESRRVVITVGQP